MRLGPKQREILQALQRGALLLNERGEWSIKEGPSWKTVDRARCMGLYTRGYIMADGERHGRVVYALTEKGKEAV